MAESNWVNFNARERLVSTDHNRLQGMGRAGVAGILRFLFDPKSSELDAGGSEVLGSATTSPMRAMILSGCRAVPAVGSVDMTITPGAMFGIGPDAVPSIDDSPATVVVDPGVPTTGLLTLTGGSGSVRVDVVECSIVTEVTETDSRDVFNPVTGLFTPATVPKVSRKRLAWRIRTGTPGGGFPGTASGWLPVAVCVVSSAASTWDDVVVFDVRPLVSDLRRSAGQVSVADRSVTRSWLSQSTDVGETTRLLQGLVESEIGSRIAGGELLPAIDLITDAASYIEPGTTFASSGLAYLYAAFPFGLPRWCRYTPASVGARRPGGFRGIPVVSLTAPTNNFGNPFSALALPSAPGLGGTTANAVMIAAIGQTAFGGGNGTADFVMSNGEVNYPFPAQVAGTNNVNSNATLLQGTHFPRLARAIKVRLSFTWTATASTAGRLSVTLQLNSASVAPYFVATDDVPIVNPASGSIIAVREHWVPVPYGTTPANLVFLAQLNAPGSPAVSGVTLKVVGWRL